MRSSTVFERQPPSTAVVHHALERSRHGAFWIDHAPGDAYGALHGDRRYDLAVVGGGYAGLWTGPDGHARGPDEVRRSANDA